MSGLEPVVGRVLTQAAQKLFGTVKTHGDRRKLREDTRALVAVGVADGFVGELTGSEAQGLADYLRSPEFEEVALQYVLARAVDRDAPEFAAELRAQLRAGLGRSLRSELLVTAVDLVHDALVIGAHDHIDWAAVAGLSPATAAAAAHLTAAAAANSRLLREVGDVVEIHSFGDRLRDQMVALHGLMSLPHLRTSRAVRYDELYVDPVLRPEQDGLDTPSAHTFALPGRRSVILGDPGAGKSTLAAKLAHDLASDLVPGAEGRVPFLLVLRNFAGAFRDGDRSLTHYLEQVCAAPYNLVPPPGAVEYLLRNGRAVVLLDGLDELVSPELRRNVVQLVNGFVHRYPLVPVVVTARRIGYAEVPLDRRLFEVGIVAEMSEGQVERYAERWFDLDSSTPQGERVALARSFLRESREIPELRSNPLLLALLCEMYSREHFIPRNLAEIYEQCALMLFNRWDSMRDIGLPVQFHGRLRGAVQNLAWRMFTAEEAGKSLPRHRIVRLLVEYLVAKKFDEDEATATAERFLEFCTGRAWVLTDVGTTDSIPQYGFTHRTFLEFFAAEHLVRTHSTPERLWTALKCRVEAGEWEVVAQIALQLLDRNVDEGVDVLLRSALDPGGRPALLHFAARSLGYVQPARDVVDAIVTAALESALEPEVEDRFHYGVGPADFDVMRERDGALLAVLYDSAPENLDTVRSSVSRLLDTALAAGRESAFFVLCHLDRMPSGADQRNASIWRQLRVELITAHQAAWDEWKATRPWWRIRTATELPYLVRRFGARTLYLNDAFLAGSLPSIAARPGKARDAWSAGADGDDLRSALVAAPRPWITAPQPWSWGLEQTGGLAFFDSDFLESPHSLIPIPVLEALASRSGEARTVPVDESFSPEVQAFLHAWERRVFDLVAQPGSHDELRSTTTGCRRP
ncbi:NACHT domain-containing protein [Actinosynnema sp. NPDC051121]